jgi:hypothetical protein
MICHGSLGGDMSFSDFYNSIASPELKAVARHWNEIRGSRPIPAWTDIHPRAITRQLPIIWSYTYDLEADLFTGRLAGEEIKCIFGSSFRDVPMTALYPSDYFTALFDRSKHVVREPAFFHGAGHVFRHLGRAEVGERIIMPFAPTEALGGGIWGATYYPHRVGKSRPEVDLSEEAET